MSSNHPGSNLFGGVLVLLLIGGLGYVVTQTNQPSAPAQGGANDSITPEGLPATSKVATTPVPTKESSTNKMPALLYIKPVGSDSQLMKRDDIGTETVLFTDSDLKTKLGTILGIHDGKAIVVLTLADGQSQLSEISLDGSGNLKTLNSNFNGMSGAALRSTNKTVAFAVFDNSERSFGFTLIQEQLDGSEQSTIDQDPQGISLPAWSQTGTNLAYIKGQATPESGQQIRLAQNGSNPKTITTIDSNSVITDLAWLDDHSLLYVLEPLGNNAQNKAKTMVLHIDSGEQQELLDLPGKERFLTVSQNAGWLAAVTGDANQSSAGVGKLMVVELSSGKQQELANASAVGAWLNQ
jgi:hypothetical protein